MKKRIGSPVEQVTPIGEAGPDSFYSYGINFETRHHSWETMAGRGKPCPYHVIGNMAFGVLLNNLLST